MRIRSTAIAPTSSGGPISACVTRWVTRAAGLSGVSAALVVSIGGKSPDAALVQVAQQQSGTGDAADGEASTHDSRVPPKTGANHANM